MRYCGIDVGQEFLYPALLDLTSGCWDLPCKCMGPTAAVEWVAQRRPVLIAIDAPPRVNGGFLADADYRARNGIDLRKGGANRRVCEWRLRIGGCYSTRSDINACQVWMHTGMRLYTRFERLGFTTDMGSGGSMFEIHPTYGFRSLVGFTTRGIEINCAPLAPSGESVHWVTDSGSRCSLRSCSGGKLNLTRGPQHRLTGLTRCSAQRWPRCGLTVDDAGRCSR